MSDPGMDMRGPQWVDAELERRLAELPPGTTTEERLAAIWAWVNDELTNPHQNERGAQSAPLTI